MDDHQISRDSSPANYIALDLKNRLLGLRTDLISSTRDTRVKKKQIIERLGEIDKLLDRYVEAVSA